MNQRLLGAKTAEVFASAPPAGLGAKHWLRYAGQGCQPDLHLTGGLRLKYKRGFASCDTSAAIVGVRVRRARGASEAYDRHRRKLTGY
jgi:hypothetical protein